MFLGKEMLTESQRRCLCDLIDESDSLSVQFIDEQRFVLKYERNGSEFVFLIGFEDVRNTLRSIGVMAASGSLGYFEAAILTAWVRDVASYGQGAYCPTEWRKPATWQVVKHNFHNRLKDL